MRAAILALGPALPLVLLAPAAPAQGRLPPGGAGVSNAINQQFQSQNQLRGIQQQQTFDAGTLRLQNQTDRMYDAPRVHGPAYAPRRSGRPERER